jgi:hypothetical protein
MPMMREWKDLLNSDPTEWLLESKDPSLRYLVMTELLDVDADSSEARELRERLMAEGPVAKLLASQQPGGYWGRQEDFYINTKYFGTVWNLILLAGLGTDPEDERVRKAGEFVLTWSQRQEGGFTHLGSEQGGRKLSLPCLSGNLTWSLTKLGLGKDPRVVRSRAALVDVTDGPRLWSSGGRCLRCRSGVVKVLKALATVERTSTEERAAQKLSDIVIQECLPGGEREVGPEWTRPGFPLMWNTDLVEILDTLGTLGRDGERSLVALDTILSLQDAEGRWPQGGAFRGRCLIPLEPLGKPSRWTTLRVLTMLRRIER